VQLGREAGGSQHELVPVVGHVRVAPELPADDLWAQLLGVPWHRLAGGCIDEQAHRGSFFEGLTETAKS
jgi:hypothetical protein